MHFIDLYEQQLGKEQLAYYQSEIFHEYCGLNVFLNNFQRSHASIQADVEACIAAITPPELEAVYESAAQIKVTVTALKHKGIFPFSTDALDGIILVLGDKTIDGHGILIGDQAYVLIDLLAYASAKAYYNPVTFLVHEAVHPVQYKMSPDLYFRNHQDAFSGVICRLIAEGTATYLTKYLTGESDTDVFWLGYLKQNEVEAWVRYSKMHKAEFAEVIQRVLTTGEICETDYYRLFSVCDPENMHEGRLAYYYGYQIAESMHHKWDVESLMALPMASWTEAITNYFRQ